MILIAYSGFLCYDELSKLTCCNVKIFNTYFSLHIDLSKTGKYRKCEEATIAKGYNIACPYLMLRKYLDLAAIELSSEQFYLTPCSGSLI